MNTKRFGFAGVFAAFALAVSTLVAPSASAATEIVVWADESRGPNLTKVIAAKGDWVTGYTVKATGSSTGTIVSCTTTTTSCTLTGITNTEVWTVAVYASNANASAPTSSAGSVYAGVSSLTWYGWSAPGPRRR